MSMRRWLSALAAAAVGLGAGGAAWAQDKHDHDKKPAGKPGEAELSPEMQARMEAMAKMSEVGEYHKSLDFMVGDWTTTTRMRWEEKGPWEESKGTCKSKWILNGRFVQSEHAGEMMGQPFTGISTTGYNSLTNKFVGTWIDSCCTGIAYSEGRYDPATKTFTFTLDMDDPMKPGTKVKARYTIKATDKDHYTFEWFEPVDGKETKTMEITYTRAVGA